MAYLDIFIYSHLCINTLYEIKIKATLSKFNYNKLKLEGIKDKLYTIQGINIIRAIIIGNNIVQQYNINWSKRILGKEALAHINTKIIIQDLIPKDKLVIKPLKKTLNKLVVSVKYSFIIKLGK